MNMYVQYFLFLLQQWRLNKWIIVKVMSFVVARHGGAEGRHDGRGHVRGPGAGDPLCHACWSHPRDAPADGAHAALLHGPVAGAVGRPTQRTVRVLLLLSLSSGVRLSCFLCLFFPLTFLSLHSKSTVANSYLFCCSPFFSHSFQISLNATLPLHSRSSFHFLGICSLWQFFISHVWPISANSSSVFLHPFFSYLLSSLPWFFSSIYFHKPAPSRVVFLLMPTLLSQGVLRVV